MQKAQSGGGKLIKAGGRDVYARKGHRSQDSLCETEYLFVKSNCKAFDERTRVVEYGSKSHAPRPVADTKVLKLPMATKWEPTECSQPRIILGLHRAGGG